MRRLDTALDGSLSLPVLRLLYTWRWDALLLHLEENSHNAEKVRGKGKGKPVHTLVSSRFLIPSCPFAKSMTCLEMQAWKIIIVVMVSFAWKMGYIVALI